MQKFKIAIVGLGRVGTQFLKAMSEIQNLGVELTAVCELSDTEGKKLAIEKGIKTVTIDELINLGENLDLIFDLTGLAEVRKELREKLEKANNTYTTVIPENAAKLIWTILTEEALPDVHGDRSGY